MVKGKAEALYKLGTVQYALCMHQRKETKKSCKICSQQTELFLKSRCFAPIMAHAPSNLHLQLRICVGTIVFSV